MFKKLIYIIVCFNFVFYSLPANEPSQNSGDSPHPALEASVRNVQKVFDYLISVYESDDTYNGMIGALKLNEKQVIFLSLVLDIRQKELEMSDHYYQVVTAQDPRFFAYQVIAKTLYEQLHQQSISDFEFLRFPNPDFISSREELFKRFPNLYWTEEQALELSQLFQALEKNIDDMTRQEIMLAFAALFDFFKLSDSDPEVSRQIISASFSLESYAPFDSTLFVFLYGQGVNHHNNDPFVGYLADLFDMAGLSKNSYQPYLKPLIEAAPKVREGLINQIFVPKEKVKQYLYVAHPFGFLDEVNDTNIDATFSAMEEERLKPDYDPLHLSQVRVIAGSLFDGETKILRYTLIPPEEQEAYVQYARDIIGQILETEGQKSPQTEEQEAA